MHRFGDRLRFPAETLSVFANVWTLEATQAVCADDALTRQEILRLLMRLINQSLVSAGSRQPHAQSPPRLRPAVRCRALASSGWMGSLYASAKIASLMASGLSNHEISERLVITEGTVEVHVKHILGNVLYRAQLTTSAASRALRHLAEAGFFRQAFNVAVGKSTHVAADNQ